MVWHTHMLNPRAFLEDCMLSGLRSFWATGMPWHLIHAAITTSFTYTVTPACKDSWTTYTGLAWSNADDPLTTTIPCPRCTTSLQIPWTTCSRPSTHPFDGIPDLTGTGYGDGTLHRPCPTCQATINKPLLCVSKFITDVNTLLNPTTNRPMPGTLLDFRNGTPTLSPSSAWRGISSSTFPNELLRKRNTNPKMQVTGLISSSSATQPTMHDVRTRLGKMVQRNGSGAGPGQYMRKMMARYWENDGPFALDLGPAVLRQGVFGEKMHKLDWLHSPTARETMERLVGKYGRFFDIMAKHRAVAVPTLDVDLAWHTHQLSPGAYYQYSVAKTGRFVDHDDKIDEDALSAHFAWTSKVYQDTYGEVYSECTCWYCEAVRTAVINPLGRLLGISAQEQGRASPPILSPGTRN